MTPLEIGEIFGSFSQKPPLQTKTLPCKPNTGVVNVKVVATKLIKNTYLYRITLENSKSDSASGGVCHGTSADGTWCIFHFRPVPVITFMAERKVDNLQ